MQKKPTPASARALAFSSSAFVCRATVSIWYGLKKVLHSALLSEEILLQRAKLSLPPQYLQLQVFELLTMELIPRQAVESSLKC